MSSSHICNLCGGPMETVGEISLHDFDDQRNYVAHSILHCLACDQLVNMTQSWKMLCQVSEDKKE
jgi:hypothetical protein